MNKAKRAKKSKDSKKCPEMDYYLNENLSDVWFEVEDTKIPAFKALLCLKSEVFRAQFSPKPNVYSSPLRRIPPNLIIVPDATVDGFKVMLRYLHDGELVLTDDKKVDLCLDVLNLSHKYKLKQLKNKMSDHFRTKLIDINNFADIYVFASDRKYTELIAILDQFIRKNFETLIAKDTTELLELNTKTQNSLFKMLAEKQKLAIGRRRPTNTFC